MTGSSGSEMEQMIHEELRRADRVFVLALALILMGLLALAPSLLHLDKNRFGHGGVAEGRAHEAAMQEPGNPGRGER